MITSSLIFIFWWVGMDSNHRRHSRRIYSPLHLAALQPTHNCQNFRTFCAGAQRWNRTTDTSLPIKTSRSKFCICKLFRLPFCCSLSQKCDIFGSPQIFENPCVCFLTLRHFARFVLVPKGGIEPPTQGFSVPCSTD